uniref:AIPP2-like SPOC-like domain-containing protein n=1 Tax=Davidia involucrata TaxID=16924 RepID=A0A5B6Z9X3_DAVIN
MLILLSPFKSRACNDGHHTSSETSNILSACSSHDSFSENAESKASLSVSDTSEGIMMLSKVASDQIVEEDKGFSKLQIFCGNRIYSNHEKQKVSESNGDDISCISGADSPSMMVDDHRRYRDRKNVSCSSASVNSFLQDVGHNCSCRPTKFAVDSLQDIVPFSDKSNPLEISSLRDVCAGASSLKGDLSEHSMEQVESSFARVATISLDGYKQDALDSTESVKPKTEVGPATEALKCSDQNEDLVSLEVPNVPPVQSQTVDCICNDGSDLVEDVKVCDICGDAGREKLLAICSKCSDGAEHIYCMWAMLDKVPEGNWMCEDCMLLEETESQKQNKFEKVVGTSEGSSLNEIRQNDGNSSSANIKTLDIKGSNVEKSRSDEVSSVPHCSAKRPAVNSESGSVSKRRALETNVGSPLVSSPCGRASLSRDSTYKILDKGKVRPAFDTPSFGDRSSNNTRGNVCLPTISDHNSPKSQTHPLMSRGILTKSKSFNISDSKLKIQPPAKDILQKQKFSRETATSVKKKDGIVRMISKSMSFNNVSSGCSNAADSKIKMLSSNFSQVKDLKRLRHVKIRNSIQNKCTGKLDNQLVSSPMAGSCISTSKGDKKITSHGKTILPHSPGTKCRDLKAVRHHGSSSNSSKPTSHLDHEDSKYSNNLAGSGVLKRLRSCLSDVDGGPSSSSTSDSSHELKPNVVVCKDKLTKSSSLTASRHCGSSDAIAQDIVPQSRESSNQDEKTKEISRFSWAGEHISADSRSVCCHKCKNMDHAAESCPIISPWIPVLDAGSPKEVGQSNKMDLGPVFCNQPDASRILAVPKLDYIWKGGFEIQSSGILSSFCYGIQAHLSTCASPKVHEAAKKFPCKVLLEEVPRLSTWPAQYLENHPKEDSVGLYFFAEDLESYRRNYESLLECMINYDLALKGNLDGIELLIFSSNLLPEKSQRWNKLFFLWGVFRGRRVNNVECTPVNQKKTSIPSLNDVPLDQDLSMPAMSGCRNMCSSGKSSECLSASKLFYNVQQSSTSVDPQELPSVPSGRTDIFKQSSSEQKYFSSETNFVQQPSRVDTISLSSTPIKVGQLCGDMQHTDTSLKEHGVPTRRPEDCLPHLQASHKLNTDCVLWRGGGAHNVEIVEDSRTTGMSLFSAGPVDGMLGVKSSHLQVLSSDCKDWMKSEFLDLELSLGVGNKSATQVFVPSFLGTEDKKNNQDKNPNSVTSKTNNCGDNDEFSASLKLSLMFPSYDK